MSFTPAKGAALRPIAVQARSQRYCVAVPVEAGLAKTNLYFG